MLRHLPPGKETPLFTLPLRKQGMEAIQWEDCPRVSTHDLGKDSQTIWGVPLGSWAKLWSMYSSHSVKLLTVEHVTKLKKKKIFKDGEEFIKSAQKRGRAEEERKKLFCRAN